MTRGRVHDKLHSIGLLVPTREEQEQDVCAADKHYECGFYSQLLTIWRAKPITSDQRPA